MSTIALDFVSQDHMVFSGNVSEIIAPGIEGELGILPKHQPLITVLAPGEVTVRREGDEDLFFAITGGWMEVRPNHVTILARTAERADEINLQRAEEARQRAQRLLEQGAPREEIAGIGLALRRSQVRLRVARRHGGPRSRPPGQGPEGRIE